MKPWRSERRKNTKTRRSKDGTWVMKNKKAHFGHKLHTIQEAANDRIMNYAKTTVSGMNYRLISQYKPLYVLRIRGILALSEGGIDVAMDRSLKGYSLPAESIRCNMRKTRRRSKGESPYSVIKTILHDGHVFVTTISRVWIKNMFMGLEYNLMCMIRMKNKGMIA